MGTLASKAEIGVWVQAPGACLWSPAIIPLKKILRLYTQNCNVMHFGWKMVRNAVHDAFLNTLKWERRSHSFRQLFNIGDGVPTRSASK